MGALRVHLLLKDGEDVIGFKKLKAENYDSDDFDDMDLNALERQVIHEIRIADEQIEENNLRGDEDDATDLDS